MITGNGNVDSTCFTEDITPIDVSAESLYGPGAHNVIKGTW